MFSTHEVSRDWLSTLLENKGTNRTIPLTLQTIASATQLKQLQAYDSCYTTALSSFSSLKKTVAKTNIFMELTDLLAKTILN